MNVLGSPIEGMDDRFTEWALLLARTAADEVQKQLAVDALGLELAAAQQARGVAEVAREEAQAEFAAANAAHVDASSRTMPEPLNQTLYFGSAVGLALLGFPAGMAVHVVLSVVMVLAAAGVYWYYLNESKKIEAARSSVSAQVSEAETQLGKLKVKRDATSDAADAAARNVRLLRDALRDAPASQPIEGIGRAYLPIRTFNLCGHDVAVDESGWFPSVACTLPDFAADEAGLERVRLAVEAAANPPILLAPEQFAGSETSALFGEEVLLSGAVRDMIDMVESIPKVDVSLRLIPNDTELARAVVSGNKEGRSEPLPGVIVRSTDQERDRKAIETISIMAPKLRSTGGAAARQVDDLYRKLESLLEHYQELREVSLASVHDLLLTAMERSTWANLHFYCPKTNRVPQYLAHRLGVAVEDAHLLDQAKLIDRLNADEEVGFRLATDDSILRKLTDAYNGIEEVRYEIQRIEALLSQQEPGSGAVNIAERTRAANGLRILRQQHDQYLGQYRSALLHAITNNPRPALELSPQARLFYDPETAVWTCPIGNTEYTDLAEVEMGAILSVKDDLMMPLWTHLWTEKADFRRSEMFRTNEELLRMSEKESEKLIAVADQYRGDMRMVRENILTASAELESRVAQMNDTLEGLATTGVLEPEQQEAIDRKMRAAFGGSVLAIKRHAESKEFLLGLEPQAQAERRGTSSDPIQVAMSPSILFAPVQAQELQVSLR